MSNELFKQLLESRKCEIVEHLGGSDFIVQTDDGERHQVTTKLPVYVGGTGRYLGNRNFISSPLM